MMSVSLKAKLGALFVILAIIAATQGGVSVLELSSIQSDVKGISKNWLPSLSSINQIRLEIDQVRIKQYRILTTSGWPAPIRWPKFEVSASSVWS